MGVLESMATVDAAFDNPVMRCVRSSFAAANVALLEHAVSTFGNDIKESSLYSAVVAGISDILAVPGGARRLPKRYRHELGAAEAESFVREMWMAEGPEDESPAHWVVRRPVEDGENVYRVTADAWQAISLFRELGAASSSMTAGDADSFKRAAADAIIAASPTSEAAQRASEAELARAQAYYDRTHAQGDEAPEPDPDEVADRVGRLLGELAAAEQGLARMAELYDELAVSARERVRTEPVASVAKAYMQREVDMAEESDELRQANLALEAMTDPTSYAELLEQLAELQSSPGLAGDEAAPLRARLAGSTDAWNRGLDSVMASQAHVRSVIANAQTNRLQSARGRSYMALLARWEDALKDWAQGARPGDEVPFAVPLFKAAEPECRLRDPKTRVRRDPAPLAEAEEPPEGPAVSLEAMDRLGSHTKEQMLRVARSPEPTLADAFNDGSASDRSPAEAIGLLPALELGAWASGTRPLRVAEDDGTSSLYLFPDLPLTDETRKAMEDHAARL